jgi:HAD superfamily hydrolase (TIGR01549 family)
VIRAAVFDFGETLVSEERSWRSWADWIGVAHQELFAALGAVIERRVEHILAFELLSPGFDLSAALAQREAAGLPRHEALYELYPDAPGALERLRTAGIRVGAAGNQPLGAENALTALFRAGELVATSAAWGLSKPDPAFFARIATELALPPADIAYVGDRVDFDVVPAAAAGMFTVHLRRGPWGEIHAGWPEAARATFHADDLHEAVDHLLSRNG